MATSTSSEHLTQEPPYRSAVQVLGEIPTVVPDALICGFLLFLFGAAFAAHSISFRYNLVDGKKFLITPMVIAFCLTRIIATSLRIAWACQPNNVQVEIAASVFIYAGIVLLFLTNLIFSQRILRAQHPHFGWSKPSSILFSTTLIGTVAVVLCLISGIILRSYTLDSYSLDAAIVIEQFSSIWLAVISFLPILIVGGSSLARQHPKIRMTKTTDKFGDGSMRAKIVIVLTSAAVLCLGASFRAGVSMMPPVPVVIHSHPPRPAPEPWYLSKACFYTFNFGIEICICIFWLAARLDKRFHVPDGASGAFSYAGGFIFAGEAGNEKQRMSNIPSSEQGLASTPSLQDSKRASRISLGSQKRAEMIDKRISWGGVSQDELNSSPVESEPKVLPYQTTEDIGIDGIEKELGWDPKTGLWATRRISGVSNATSRPVSTTSYCGHE